MADLLLLPTLERLGPYSASQPGKNQPTVGMVFSVALNRNTSYQSNLQEWIYEFLRPWSWADGPKFQAVEEMKVYYAKNGDPQTWFELAQPLKIKNEIPGDAYQADGLSALRKRLDQRFGCFKDQESEPWAWPPQTDHVRREARPWPAFLGEVSLLPWPLAQVLGLSFFYAFKDGELPADANLLIAAPILRLGPDGQSRILIPSLPTVSANHKDAWELKYSDGAVSGLTVTVVTQACSLEKPPDSIFLDLDSLWVQKTKLDNGSDAPGDDVHSEDWRQGLELRLAAELNWARLRIDNIRDQLKEYMAAQRAKALQGKTDSQTPAIPPELAATYPEKIMAVLEDVRKTTFPAFGGGFLGGSLLRRITAEWRREDGKRFFDESVLSSFEKVAQRQLDLLTNDKWLDLVSRAKFQDGQAPEVLERARKKELNQMGLIPALDSLDQLSAALQQDATMTSVFRAVWSAIKENIKELGDQDAAKDWDADSRELLKALIERKSLAGVNLGIELLGARVGNEWQAELKSSFTSSSSLPQVRKTLEQSITAKLSTAGFTPAWAQKRASDIVAVLLPDPATDTPATARPTGAGSAGFRSTRGLTFQVDTLAADDPNAEDILRKIQGIAVLARKEGKEWCCLNLAEARVGDLTIADPVVRPSRLAYLNGLRTATLTYDNQPLTVPGPLASADVSGVSAEPDKATSSPLDEPLVDYVYSRTAHLPELAFGQTYEILPFIVTNSGVLPRELANSAAQPGRLRLPIGSLGGKKSLFRSHQYKREAHVGALRFVCVSGVDLPPIPSGVSPRVRELPATRVLPKGDPLLSNVDTASNAAKGGKKAQGDASTKDETQQTDSMLAGTPLLLLASEDFPTRPGIELRNNFSFKILPPAIDLKTWDRWVARTRDKDHRRFIWRSFYQQSYERGEHEEGKAKGKLEEKGVYLDDPAVAGFWAELSAFDSDGQPLASVTSEIALGSPRTTGAAKGPDGTDLSSEQHDGMRVLCSVAGEALTVEINGNALPLNKSGNIYRLSLYARIDAKDLSRFRWKEAVRENAQYGLTSPWHLLIEIPQTLPKGAFAPTVYQALMPKAPADGESSLTVALDLNKAQELRPHLHRAELWYQVWNWRGRPPALHPALHPTATLLDFEMSELGERSDDEHARRPMKRLPQDKPHKEPAGSAFSFEMNLSELELRGNIRALYHRFSARVFSRWEGILPEAESFVAAMDEVTRNRWQGLFVPCRYTGDVPVPKIKLVLPLTQGDEGSATPTPPGLLVVVDGSWYEVGGLAEELGVEVMTVTGPDSKDGKVKKPEYYQIGTDPIVTGMSAGEELKDHGALSKVKEDEFIIDFDKPVIGAIGHQRDRSRTNPHFLASSFLLPQPTIRKGKETRSADLSWWFVKLRFFRKLISPGGGELARSDFSAPFWVQFLPGVERIEYPWFGAGAHKIELKGDVLTVTTDGMPKDNHPFYLFGVMTRKVTDFAGRPDQESYLGVWQMASKDGGKWTTDHSPVVSKDDTFFIRWIEVQSAQSLTLNGGDELWRRLFDLNPPAKVGAAPDLERARIVRISKPFPVTIDKGAL